MQGLLRRAARTLLAAGVLSFVHTATAQEALPQLQPVPITPAAPLTTPAPVEEPYVLPKIVTPVPPTPAPSSTAKTDCRLDGSRSESRSVEGAVGAVGLGG